MWKIVLLRRGRAGACRGSDAQDGVPGAQIKGGFVMLSRKLRRSYKGGDGRAGLTLLELVVVIAILAALAGILVPLLPTSCNRPHAATGATNLSEIAKAVQLYASQNGDNYPNQLDTIVDGSGTS